MTSASDASQPRCWRLPPDRSWVIGREGASAEIAIADPNLADRHATVRWKGRTVELRATGTDNRPIVDGEAVLHARVPIGGSFTVGNHTFQVSAPEEISLIETTIAPPPHSPL